MRIQGLQKLTLLDFPGRVACTVFLPGCNLRCPFCHNPALVLPDRETGGLSTEELLAVLLSYSLSHAHLNDQRRHADLPERSRQ